MNIDNLKKEKIAIIGLSREGISSAKFLFRNEIPFTVLDMQREEEIGAKIDFIKKWGCEYRLGGKYLSNLEEFTLVLRSPGVPLFNQEIKKAREQGTRISSNTKLFMEISPTQNIIGVTGTKGKGTTCKLIESVFKVDGRDVYVGGNIGNPPLDFIEKLTSDSYVILELSSFQLEDFERSPHICVVLGIAPDHLAPESDLAPNYHKSYEYYIEAKKNLVHFQKNGDYIVVKNDDQVAKSFVQQDNRVNVYYYSRLGEVDRGGFVEDQELKFRDQKDILIGDVKNIKLRGKHHLENVCAALSVCGITDCATLSIQNGLFKFQGYEHRLEFVDKIGGISYYDDSAATNPEPAIAAIDSFNEPIIIILGGSEKGQDYKKLGEKINNSSVKIAYLIGDMASKIENSILQVQSSKLKIQNNELKIIKAGYPKMGKIIKDCTDLAEKGDVILLSPACASFDMFNNYRERGDQFKNEVYRLKGGK